MALGDDRQGIDIQLQPVTTARIRGRVDAAPEVRANLTLRLVTDETESLGSGGEIATAMVTTSGEFTFLGVPSGRYTIVAQPVVGTLLLRPPSGADGVRPPNAPAQFGSGRGGSAIYAAPPGTFFDLAQHPRRAGMAWTHCRRRRRRRRLGRRRANAPRRHSDRPARARWPAAGGNGTRPVDARRRRLAGRRSGRRSGRSAARSVRTTPTQSFSLTGLLAGEYVLELVTGNIRRSKSIVWDGRDYTYRPFDTTPGADISGVVDHDDGSGGARSTAAPVDARGRARRQRRRHLLSGRARAVDEIRLPAVAAAVGRDLRPAERSPITRIPAGEYFVIAVNEIARGSLAGSRVPRPRRAAGDEGLGAMGCGGDASAHAQGRQVKRPALVLFALALARWRRNRRRASPASS